MTPAPASEIVWASPWPAWLLALAAAGAAGAVIWLYAREPSYVARRRRAVLATLRLAALALVLIMVAQPVRQRSRLAPPRLAVLVDRSASMDVCDVPAESGRGSPGGPARISRLEAWHRLVESDNGLLARLSRKYEIDVVEFAAGVNHIASYEATTATPADLTATDPATQGGSSPQRAEKPADGRAATRLGEAVDHAARRLAGPRPVAVLLMSDGINTAGMSLDEAADRARTVGVPIYAVAIGSDRPRPDVAVADVRAEPVVFPGDRLQVDAAIRASGYDGKPTKVALVDVATGQPLAETEISLPADGGTTTARLPLRPQEPGLRRLAVEVAASEDEEDVTNNRRELAVEVRRQPIRTLLVAARPSFEFRALKSLLERDPAVSLRVWLQDADAGYADVEATALAEPPVTRAELRQYDVILLCGVAAGTLPRGFWTDLQQLVAEQGTGLAIVAGPRFTLTGPSISDAWAALMPIEPQPGAWSASGDGAAGSGEFFIRPTPEGLQDATFQLGDDASQSAEVWAKLPAVTWLAGGWKPKPGAVVLAEGAARGDPAAEPPRPAIVRQYVGAGEVLMHTTDESWGWRWRSDDRYFARYWGQAVRRLARGRTLRGAGSLATDRVEYAAGEPVHLRARLRPAGEDASTAERLDVTVEGQSTPTRVVQLARSPSHRHDFDAVLRDLPADRYTARMALDGQPPVTAEFVVEAPPSELSRLAVDAEALAELAATTGGKFYRLDAAGRLETELPPPRSQVVERLPATPLWNSPWLVGGLCAALAGEWLLRRRSGML